MYVLELCYESIWETTSRQYERGYLYNSTRVYSCLKVYSCLSKSVSRYVLQGSREQHSVINYIAFGTVAVSRDKNFKNQNFTGESQNVLASYIMLCFLIACFASLNDGIQYNVSNSTTRESVKQRIWASKSEQMW